MCKAVEARHVQAVPALPERARESRVFEAESALRPLRVDVFRHLLHKGAVDAPVLPREEIVVAHDLVEDQHETRRGLLLADGVHDQIHAAGTHELSSDRIVTNAVLNGLQDDFVRFLVSG